MKRDIRKLFNEDDFESKKLPKNHKIEFVEKLKLSKTIRPKKSPFGLFLKIAASLALLITVGYYAFSEPFFKPKEQTTLGLQMQQIEQQYLVKIDNEWQKFISSTTDTKLINKYKEKLDNLNDNYTELSKSFKEDTNNITALEDLIKNLQTRLQLLKNIQDHMKILNEKKKTYEIITL